MDNPRRRQAGQPVPRRRIGRNLPSAALLVLATLASAGCGADEPRARRDAAEPVRVTSADFVGRAACAACHQAQEERWRDSHHDLAMQVARSDTVLGDFDDVAVTHEGVTTRFFRRGEELWARAEGPDGGGVDLRIDFTFGVEPLQQYLVPLADGRYQALDIAWDSRPAEEGGQRWFHLRPGERYPPGDPLHWSGIAYNWNTMCADCHSTDVRKNYIAADDSYRTTFAEIDVSCEACHGPGSAHVDWADAWLARTIENGNPPVAGDAGIDARQMGLQVEFPALNDAAWDIDPDTGLAQRNPPGAPAADVELCARCHARRGPIAEEYRFGEPLTDSYRVALLEEGLYHADGQILDEVFVYGSFVQSRMYQAGVGCSDCHEPHGLEPYVDGNGLCNRCHLGAKFDTPEHHHHEVGTDGAACVSCHMPASTYMVVDPRRDHSFRVPRPDLSLRFGTPNACADCHAEQGDRWAADAVERWFGPDRAASWTELLAAGRSRRADAEDALRALVADATAPPIARATALSLLPPNSQSSIFEIERGLRDPAPLVRAGALSALDAADPTTVMRLAPPLLSDSDRSVRLEAARVIAGVPPQLIPPARRDAVTAAIDEYRDAQRVNEDRAQAHLNLGRVALQQGDVAGAEQAYRDAIRREPRFIPALINLADLYRLQGRDIEGEQLLRRAIEIAPDSGDAHHALGLLLVRLDRQQEALEALRRASSLAPDSPRYLYVYAVALHTAGDAQAALDVLDRGLARFPADRELLFAAVAFSRERGDLGRALEYARRWLDAAPEDPQAMALVRELERIR